MKLMISIALSLALLGCGGGADPFVNGVKSSLMYGKQSSVTLGGYGLRQDMIADFGVGCANPLWSPLSKPELAILVCTPSVVGDLPLAIRTKDGATVFSTTIQVPKPQVQFNSSAGVFTLELDPVAAPITVVNFLAYVHAGFYSDTLFHRVIPNFVVQGGGYTAGLVRKPTNAPIALESNNGLSNARASVAMARTSVFDSATSQFFVNLRDNSQLNYQSPANPGYAVFGSVVSGMDVVDVMATQATSTQSGLADVPVVEIVIQSARQIQ